MGHILREWVLRLFRMLKLFPSLGTKVVNIILPWESTGSGFLGDPYGFLFKECAFKSKI